jgi:hypothetical protein
MPTWCPVFGQENGAVSGDRARTESKPELRSYHSRDQLNVQYGKRPESFPGTYRVAAVLALIVVCSALVRFTAEGGIFGEHP